MDKQTSHSSLRQITELQIISSFEVETVLGLPIRIDKNPIKISISGKDLSLIANLHVLWNTCISSPITLYA